MIFPRLLLGLILAAAPAVAAESRARPTRPAANAETETAYKGAIAIDAHSGRVLFEDRADLVSPPASMTKLMTFAVVSDALRRGSLALDTPVRVSAADARMGGTQVYLDPRETFVVRELLFAMMVQSANDAAHALARTASGSVPAFVAAMNAKAAELGLKDTVFRTPHGLPPASRRTADGDLTSPRDFALLSRHLVLHTDVLTYASVRTRNFGEGSRAQPMAMTNHNHLLGKVAGVDGLKTGYTACAGFCLAATAARDRRRVIVVMMGSPQARTRDLHVSDLIERAFLALPPAPPSSAAAADLGIRPAGPAAPAATVPAQAPAATEPTVRFSLPRR
jgi:D-alanyl-D-alanine carboxypeptidase (penicillin-binding protein 5/6)